MDDLQQNTTLRPIIDDGEGALPRIKRSQVSINDQARSRRAALEQGDCTLLPRQGLEERAVALRRGAPLPATARVLLSFQVLEELRRLLPPEYAFSAPSRALELAGLTRVGGAECETFSRSGDAVFELSMRFADPNILDAKLTGEKRLEAKKLLFHELTQVCLWGNSTDLSLLINVRRSAQSISRITHS